VRRLGDICGALRRQDRESGQATTEFALILIPLLLLVVGIIQFGIGLNYWLDMQRVANQGGRWAAVNNWPPNCPRGSTSCGNTPACNASQAGATLQATLRCQALTNGLQSSVAVTVCYPGKTPLTVQRGDPVKVELASPFKFVPILELGTITLEANATMRLEQPPTLITGALNSCP
jgi:hypothetical protein